MDTMTRTPTNIPGFNLKMSPIAKHTRVHCLRSGRVGRVASEYANRFGEVEIAWDAQRVSWTPMMFGFNSHHDPATLGLITAPYSPSSEAPHA